MKYNFKFPQTNQCNLQFYVLFKNLFLSFSTQKNLAHKILATRVSSAFRLYVLVVLLSPLILSPEEPNLFFGAPWKMDSLRLTRWMRHIPQISSIYAFPHSWTAIPVLIRPHWSLGMTSDWIAKNQIYSGLFSDRRIRESVWCESVQFIFRHTKDLCALFFSFFCGQQCQS